MNLKRKTIIISVILGIVFLALFFIFITPLLEGIRESSFQLVEAKKQLALFQDKTGSVERFETTYENITEDLERANNLLIDPDVPIEFIKFLETTAKNSDVSIKISPSILKASKNDKWDSIGFNLILTSSFTDFMRFLEKIESAYYLIKIQNLSIRRSTEQDGLFMDSITTNLKIKVFVK